MSWFRVSTLPTLPQLESCRLFHSQTAIDMSSAIRKGAGSIRRALSLTSWFYHPDIDMNGYEVLSRASACIVPAVSKDLGVDFHVIAAGHVTHPYNFPTYYPQDTHAFVHALSSENVKCMVELREEDSGQVICSAELRELTFPHPGRDLSVLHFKDAKKFMEDASSAGHEIVPVSLSEQRCTDGQQLRFDGHVLKDMPEQRLLPFLTTGVVLGRSQLQIFAKTQSVLQNGMCGGPVLDEKDESICYGVVEGIVSPPAPNSEVPKGRELLTGTAVFVENTDILSFIKYIEKYMLE